jgi:hypothetical protein
MSELIINIHMNFQSPSVTEIAASKKFFIEVVTIHRIYAGSGSLRVWFSCVKYIAVETRWQ